MSKDSEVNWGYIVSIVEFQSYLDFNLLKEISMVSNLMRERLKPLLFKNLKLDLDFIKFNSNVISIAHYMQYQYSNYDYSTLREENNGSIESSLKDFIIELSDISKYTKSFNYIRNSNAGYYLYSLINLFDNLTELKMYDCKIPYEAFAEIGKTLPNLNRLELVLVYLIKSTTDIISENDITFPPNLSCMKFSSIYVCLSTLLLDPFEFLFRGKCLEYFQYFILPKVSIPTLKRLDFISYKELVFELDEFLEVNPNVEYLYTRKYSLNLTSSLNSLKSLDIDDKIRFYNIDQDYRLNSINSLKFSTCNYSEDFIKLYQVCSNLVDLNLIFTEKIPNFHSIIDKYLASDLAKLQHLKTLVIVNNYDSLKGQILDFTKFSQIEKLKVEVLHGSLLNIKFDNCKSLKRVELMSYYDEFTYELERKFNQHKNWVFKLYKKTIKGYKI